MQECDENGTPVYTIKSQGEVEQSREMGPFHAQTLPILELAQKISPGKLKMGEGKRRGAFPFLFPIIMKLFNYTSSLGNLSTREGLPKVPH